MNKTIRRLIPAALAAALILLSACSDAAKSNEGQSSLTGTAGSAALSNFTATDLQGAKVDQSIFKGYKLTMINIWATFCGPCLREMPGLGQVSKEYAGKGVQMIGIVSDASDINGAISQDQVEAAKEIVKKTGASYRHILPSKDLINAKLKDVVYVPTTIFVDENGQQVGNDYASAKSAEKWKQIIDSLLS